MSLNYTSSFEQETSYETCSHRPLEPYLYTFRIVLQLQYVVTISQSSKAKQNRFIPLYTNIVAIVTPVSQVNLALGRTSAKSIWVIAFSYFTHSF